MKDTFEEYREKYDDLKKTYQQNEGRLHAIMEELKSEYNVSSLEEAVELLSKIEKKVTSTSDKMKELLLKIQAGLDAIEEAMDESD